MAPYAIIIVTFFLYQVSVDVNAQANEDRVNLTSVVTPLIVESKPSGFMSGGELFSDRRLTTRGEVHYSIRVRNQTDDPIDANSLIIVVDNIIGLAQARNAMNDVEVVGYDGRTKDGKPFFRVPADPISELAPHQESNAVEVLIRNPNLLRLATPTFQVWGIQKTEDKKIEELGQVLIKKGILTPEEAAQLLDPSRLPHEP